MKHYHEAIDILVKAAERRSLSTENISIESSIGRVLSETLRSREPLPSFDNSSMDGFALRAEETSHASLNSPARFQVRASLSAGDVGVETIQAGTAIEIMTGAPMPRGHADAVVKVEEVQTIRNPDGRVVEIEVMVPVSRGQNVRVRGTDIERNELLLSQGRLIKPEHLLALAAQGISTIPVYQRPRVAVIATGRELVDYATETLEPGMIRNSTSPFLKAVLPGYGVEVVHFSVIDDDAEAFESRLRKVLELGVDLVLTTGAVSMGIHDFVPDAVKRVGGEARFHKVAIRPGKPLLFAEWGEKGPVLIGVPGNPVSTAVGLRFFISPYLRALNRMPPEPLTYAELEVDSPKPEGLKCFFKAFVREEDGRRWVQALGGQASYQVKPLLQSNAWVVFEESNLQVLKGTRVCVAPLLPEGGF